MSLNPAKERELMELGFRARQHVVRMSAKGGCFLGAALSCVDLIAYLYSEVLEVTPVSMTELDRNYFLLSKGHGVPALYAVLAEFGFLAKERLTGHLNGESGIYWHPNPDLLGVEFQSGSLGHLLSVGLGIAMVLRLCQTNRRVFVLLGDGELNEGSVWEALLVAQAHALNNLVVIVDRNRLQANLPTEELIPLEPLSEKFRSFGCEVREFQGHAFGEMPEAFRRSREGRGPLALIAHTVRGKGLPSLEGRPDGWFVGGDATGLEQELKTEWQLERQVRGAGTGIRHRGAA